MRRLLIKKKSLRKQTMNNIPYFSEGEINFRKVCYLEISSE